MTEATNAGIANGILPNLVTMAPPCGKQLLRAGTTAAAKFRLARDHYAYPIVKVLLWLAPAPKDQNRSFRANWICREGLAVAVITPAEEL